MCLQYTYKLSLKFSLKCIHSNYAFYCFRCRVCPNLSSAPCIASWLRYVISSSHFLSFIFLFRSSSRFLFRSFVSLPLPFFFLFLFRFSSLSLFRYFFILPSPFFSFLPLPLFLLSSVSDLSFSFTFVLSFSSSSVVSSHFLFDPFIYLLAPRFYFSLFLLYLFRTIFYSFKKNIS
jgi:hypothetical protein